MKVFKPDGEVLTSYMADAESRVKVIQGPVGSGTSSMCCMHIYQQAMAQAKQADGMQRFRADVYRETYPLLEETTIKTWLEWFPEKDFGRFYWSTPFRHLIRVGPIELDVTFTAVEDINDAKTHFKSREPSLVWFNEGQFANWLVFGEAVERVSPPRYPRVIDGGCTWGGMLLDTNAPPADHWIPIMRGDVPPPDFMTEDQKRALVKPANWRFFLQPPGLIEIFEGGVLVGYKPNPAAENLKYLHKAGVDPLGPENFYMQKIGGKTKSWIDANIMNRSSVVVDGKPVYPLFRRDAHVSEKRLQWIPGVPTIVGLDNSGRNPAALIGQTLRGDWFIQREFIGVDMPMVEFAPQLKTFLKLHYPDAKFVFWGDPAGGQRGSAYDTTPEQVFRAHGMMVRPSPDAQNRQSLRQEAVNAVLLRRSATQGRSSALCVDAVGCPTYVAGMSGGYHFKRIQVSGERYAEEPAKNQYSHVCEAGEYMMLGGGEGRGVVMAGSRRPQPTQTVRPYDPFRRIGLAGRR